jgi:predicted ABC-type ATPase
MKSQPEMVVVSGPNGSGRTTVATLFAQRSGYQYLGADDIAFTLNPSSPETAALEASRQFIVSITECIELRQSVVVESALSGRTFAKTVKSAVESKFTVSIVHLFLDSPETCLARIAERVQKGGHHVPENDVRRRFPRSARNFWVLYRPLCHRWVLLYNAGVELTSVAEGDANSHSVCDSLLLTSFEQIVASDD